MNGRDGREQMTGRGELPRLGLRPWPRSHPRLRPRIGPVTPFSQTSLLSPGFVPRSSPLSALFSVLQCLCFSSFLLLNPVSRLSPSLAPVRPCTCPSHAGLSFNPRLDGRERKRSLPDATRAMAPSTAL